MRRYMFPPWLMACNGFSGRLGPALFLFLGRAVASCELYDFVEHLDRRLGLAEAHEHPAVAIARLEADELREEVAIGGERGVVFAAPFKETGLQQTDLQRPRLRRFIPQPRERARRSRPIASLDRRLGETVKN